MKRIVPAVFIIITAVLASLIIVLRSRTPGERSHTQPKVVTPIVNGETKTVLNSGSVLTDETGMTSFIPLRSDETLINILTVDFDGDTRDDQINLVRKVTSPYLTLLVGLYNADTGTYERTAEIPTGISQVKTFSYNCLDVVGDHKLALVYQGITDSGETVLQIFSGSRASDKKFTLTNIGDFRADGTIFIQQPPRNDSYELSQSNGISFPVWVYSSDKNGDSGSYDQVQTKYEWNTSAYKYVQTDQLHVTGRRLAAKELDRVQSGGVKAFREFLTGLWYKTTNDGDGIRYLFFDNDNSEIIQLFNDTEEVYSWGNCSVSGSVMYLTSSNTSITNLQRRFYISLIDVDEISMRLQDDLSMTIDESNLWNGEYKKMNAKSSFESSASAALTSQDFIDTLVKGGSWLAADGTAMYFSSDGYTVSGDMVSDTGKFVGLDIVSVPVLTFRSNSKSPYLGEAYAVSFPLIPVPDIKSSRSGTVKKNTAPVYDKNTIIMKPVVLTPEGCRPAEERIVTLTRVKSGQ